MLLDKKTEHSDRNRAYGGLDLCLFTKFVLSSFQLKCQTAALLSLSDVCLLKLLSVPVQMFLVKLVY